MSSLAESSFGSVPIPQIETLRQHMLMHAQANLLAGDRIIAEGQAEQHQSQDTPSALPTHVEVPASRTTIIPRSQDAYQTPRSSPLRRQTANLVPSASAPVQEMEGMLDMTQSQNAFRMLTKAASFHTFPEGDTQPMESQVYRDYNESMVQPPKETARTTMALAIDQSLSSYDVMAASRTFRSCKEGDTGYIDLERAFQPASPGSTGGFDELLASPQTQVRTTVNERQYDASSAMPETPAFAGRKHGCDGELMTSATTTTNKTPAYSQLFGVAANGPVLSATQLFNQTQAPSSPLPDQLRSDPVITRPSPNVNGHAAVSSPPDAFSSPILPAGGRSSSAADPKGTYTSMRESQERRAARLRQELGRQAKGDEDLWLDEDVHNTARSHWQQRRMRRIMSDHDVLEVGKNKARARVSSRPSSANNMPSTISIMETPATVQRGERLEFDDEFLERSSEEDLANDDLGAHEEAGNGEPNDNDEYDELAQVLRSQANEEDGTGYVDHTLQDQIMQPENEPYVDTTVLEVIGGRNEIVRPSTQQSAIADSQPGTQEKQKYKTINHGGYHSSSASFIPGSQYTGRTSEDQARLAASQYMRTSQKVVREKIPSSPPLPTDAGLVGKNSSDMSELHAPRIEQTKNMYTSAEIATNIELEVPESDLPEFPYSRAPPSASQGESNNIPFFSTAQTHASNQAASKTRISHDLASPSRAFASQHSRVSEFSPRKAAGVRHFSEFASITPPGGSGQTQADVEAVMNDVMTAEDRDYMAAIGYVPESDTRKRRKLVHQVSVDEAMSSDIAGLPQNEQDGTDGGLHSAARQNHEDAENRAERSSSQDILCAGPRTAIASDTATIGLDSFPDFTLDSVQTRENAGAQTVSQLLSGRAARLSRKSKATPRSKAAQNRGTARSSLPKGRPADDAEEEASHEGPKGRELLRKPHQTEQSVNPVPSDAPKESEDVSRKHPQMENSDAEPRISHPERAFALFKGRYNQYFPATWLAFTREKPTHQIQFDDKTTTDIETQHICALDLRIGDTVKVDCANMRKESWVIVGFGAVTSTTDAIAPRVDIRGRGRVLVQAKSARNSAGGDTATTLLEGVTVHEVLVTNVYITQTMWKHFSDRAFDPPSAARATAPRAETPSHRPHTPNSTTPGSRTRRSAQSNTHTANPKLRDGPLAPPLSALPDGVFKGMAFALSYSPEDAERRRADTAAMIRRNGGVVLDNSFLDLFDIPGPDDKKADPHATVTLENTGDDDLTLQIKPEYADLGFVAAISDQHHRKAKYIQALALGLPTLSTRWITDCLDAGKNPSLSTPKAAPLGWGKYLLPAGESSYLHGAIRSRTLTLEDTTWAKFSTTVSARPRLLDKKGVVILSGKNKTTRENRDMFAFLASALGASNVRRAASLKETKALLEQEASDLRWVFVDGEVAEAAAELFNDNTSTNAVSGKKRKRGQESTRSAVRMSATNGKITVVNDEFVIQSLILGALID